MSNSSLRIVHCFRSPVGGIFRHVRDLLNNQVEAGHKVGIICDSSTGGSYEAALFDSISDKLELGLTRVEMQRHVGPGDIAAAWRTYRALAALKPDILHGHGAKGGVYSRIFGTFMRGEQGKTARIYSPHGGSLHYDTASLTGQVFFKAERFMEHLSDHLLFVADYERKTYETKIGRLKAAHRVVYNGLNPAEFDPVAEETPLADFVYIGMMRDLKGPDLFLDALAYAEQKTGRKLVAVMVGDGDDLDKYKAQAKTLRRDERTTFFDPMKARLAFGKGRIIVVPSRAEAMPYIVLETLAAGRPIIATQVGGIPEILNQTPNAIVEPEVASIGAKMVEVLSDEEAYRASMPQKDALKKRFGADIMAQNVETAYWAAFSARNGLKNASKKAFV